MSKILVKKSVLLECMRKSGVGREKRFLKGAGDTRFGEFKKRILAHLDSLEKDKAELKKSLIAFEAACVQKAGYPVGTIREWKGMKYIKVAPGKWRPKYDSHSRGAKMAIAALKKKADACTDSRELLSLVLENRERFSDAQGRPLPFVQELSDYVSALNDKLKDGKRAKKTPAKKVGSGGGNGGDDGNEPPKDAYKKLKTATKDEVKQFLADAMNTNENRRISLGDVSAEAKERIRNKTGKEVNRIILDSGEIRHTLKKKEHFIELSDLERIGDIVNSTTNISLEEKKHQNNDVLRFVEEVENGVNLIMEFRAKKGDLSLVTAYRMKKERADAPMENAPGQTSETLHTSTSTIPQSAEKVKEKEQKKVGSGGGNGGDDGKGKWRKTGHAATLRRKLKENFKDKLGTYTNKKTGIKARLSGDSINKMSSEKAVGKSKENGFSVDQHFEVANKIVELFENADLSETGADKKASPDLKSIKRFDSDAKLNDGTNATAHITVKESVENGHKIYSVEVMELNKNAADEKPTAGGGISKTPTSDSIIAQSAENVKEKESEAEAHENRSNAMQGNQNAKKDGSGNEPPKMHFLSDVKDWIVDLAKQIGLDIAGFKHKTTGDFERHVIKKHGNEKVENSRGQVAVTQEDLNNIQDVMDNPDIAVAGVKKNGRDRIVLVKNNEHGSILVEEVLDGKRNRALSAKTFWILDKKCDEEKIKKILSNTRGYDVSKMKTATPSAANSDLSSTKNVEGGGKPTGKDSVSDSTIPQSAEKVKEKERKKLDGFAVIGGKEVLAEDAGNVMYARHQLANRKSDLKYEGNVEKIKRLEKLIARYEKTINDAVERARQRKEEWDGSKFTDGQKNNLSDMLNNPTEEMTKVEYTRENYNKLFPKGTVSTPSGKVKLGAHQFERLGEKDKGGRKGYLGALHSTLTKPMAVIEDTDKKGRKTKLFVKSFKKSDGKECYMSVVPTIDGMQIVVSNGPRKIKELLNKIKEAAVQFFIADGGAKTGSQKTDSGSQTTGTASDLSGVAQQSDSKPADSSIIAQSSEKVKENSSREATIESIREKYTGGISVDGDEDSITLPDGTELEGKWKLVEADAPSASHDETTFRKTEGFPTNADGSTINDRDYEYDSAAKEAVIEIAGDFDSRALGIDNPVVVSEDGVVISGNNRTMSSKIAARKGTDKKYIAALEKKAGKFGFSSDDVAKFKNPRVVFETKVNGEYSTAQFAKFNESGKKAQSPVEVAVKVSKTVNAATVETVAGKINQYDTLGELYADNKAMQEVFGALIDGNVIKKTDLPAYYTREGGVTNNGKEFLETVLIGSVISENNLRSLGAPGGKEIRQKLVRAIVPLVENKGMKGYSIAKELNEGVSIAVDIKKNKKFKDADDYSRQGVLIGENPDPIAIEFAKKLEGTQKEFAEFMRGLNAGLKPAANGEADIFAGGVESREEILSRYISIKKSIRELLDSFSQNSWGGKP